MPIVSLNWSLQTKYVKLVLETLASIGFEVVLLSVDGHKTNMKFFKEQSFEQKVNF